MKCYSASPGLFPRRLPNGQMETWEEAAQRVRQRDAVISEIPEFEVITPTNADLELWEPPVQARVCLLKDLLYATQSDIVFAEMTPFCGREPDSGTVVEATACALAGKLLVLWADPLIPFAERYADAEVRPDSELDDHNNLMIEQLFYLSWEQHFGQRHPTFGSLREAVTETARQIRQHGLYHATPLLGRLSEAGQSYDLSTAIEQLLAAQ